MKLEHAFALLGLRRGATVAEIQAAAARVRDRLDSRLAEASSESEAQDLRAQLAELEPARRAALGEARPALPEVLSETKLRDLPGQELSYTEAGELEAAGARIQIQVGHVLGDRYEVRRRLGVGGMGAVYEAFDRNRKVALAVKVMLPGLMGQAQARERFLAEARIAVKLSHPGIRNVLDVHQDESFFFLTMELLEGESLRERMERYKRDGQSFAIDEALGITEQLCAALGYAHRWTVHRDVKPENIWMCPDGTVKLLDFGIARVLTPSQLTMTGMSLGSAYYMAPEQLKRAKEVDARADQYSLAVVLHELLTGDVPAGRMVSASKRRRDCPRLLARALDRALDPEPAARFGDVHAFALELQNAVVRSRFGARKLTLIGTMVLVLAVVTIALSKQRFARASATTASGMDVSSGAPSPMDAPVRGTAYPPERKPLAPAGSEAVRAEPAASAHEHPGPARSEAIHAGAAEAPEDRPPSSSATSRPGNPRGVTAPEAVPAPSPFVVEDETLVDDHPRRIRHDKTGLSFVYVQGGTYALGSSEVGSPKNEGPVRQVELTGFYLGRTEVTYRAWYSGGGEKLQSPRWPLTDDLPVVNVSWYAALEWCRRNGFDLPSEAQWEYAAAGLEKHPYAWGVGWENQRCNASSAGSDDRWPFAAPVGQFLEGASWCGSLDMTGNVWEWCLDRWEPDYSSITDGQRDPMRDQGVDNRVRRGGSFSDSETQCRTTYRGWSQPSRALDSVGLRPIWRP